MSGSIKTQKGKRIVIISAAVLIISAALFIIFGKSGEKGYRLISVSDIVGEVIAENGGREYKAYKNMRLEDGYALTTKEESYIRMLLDEDKYVKLEEMSRLVFEKLGKDKERRTQMKLERGSLTAEIAKPLGENEDFVVNTPNAVLAVRGTYYRVEVSYDENGDAYTDVYTYGGSVGCRRIMPDGTVVDEYVVISEGYKARIKMDSEITVYIEEIIDKGEIGDNVDPIDAEDIPDEDIVRMYDASLNGHKMFLTKEELFGIIIARGIDLDKYTSVYNGYPIPRLSGYDETEEDGTEAEDTEKYDVTEENVSDSEESGTEEDISDISESDISADAEYESAPSYIYSGSEDNSPAVTSLPPDDGSYTGISASVTAYSNVSETSDRNYREDVTAYAPTENRETETTAATYAPDGDTEAETVVPTEEPAEDATVSETTVRVTEKTTSVYTTAEKYDTTPPTNYYGPEYPNYSYTVSQTSAPAEDTEYSTADTSAPWEDTGTSADTSVPWEDTEYSTGDTSESTETEPEWTETAVGPSETDSETESVTSETEYGSSETETGTETETESVTESVSSVSETKESKTTASSAAPSTPVVEISEQYFPDSAFRGFIMNKFDDGDGVLTESEIADVKEMRVNVSSLSSLAGLEYFTELEVLDCSDTGLTALDLSGNTKLKELYCGHNSISYLDLRMNPALEVLECSGCSLGYVNLPSSGNISQFSASGNIYTIPSGADRFDMTTLGTGFDKSKVSGVSGAVYDSATGVMSGITGSIVTYTYDCGQGYSETFALSCSPSAPSGTAVNAVNFPDAVFRTYVSENFDTDSDGKLSESEIAAVNRISINRRDMLSVSGIEFFTELTNLSVYGSGITTIDVSKNTALTVINCQETSITSLEISNNIALNGLRCSGTNITELDVSHNTALTNLSCSNTKITELNVSHNTALTTLNCGNTKITELDVSHNIALKNLYCNDTYITKLDLSNNTALTYLRCGGCRLAYVDLSANSNITNLNALGNKYTIPEGVSSFDMTTIRGFDKTKVSDVVGASYDSATGVMSGITGSTVTYKYNCGQGKSETFTLLCSPSVPAGYVALNADNFPDSTFRSIIAMDYDDDNDGYLSPGEIAYITRLDVSNNSAIGSVKGIEYFTALEELDCAATSINQLDISKNTALVTLNCSGTQIRSLDVSKNTALRNLYCSSCSLAYVDISDSNIGVFDASYNVYILSTGGRTPNLNNISGLDLSKIVSVSGAVLDYTTGELSDLTGSEVKYTYSCRTASGVTYDVVYTILIA